MTGKEAGATIVAMERRYFLLPIFIVAIGGIAIGLHAADEPNAKYTVRILALPDHGQGNITMDYIVYDPKTGYVWVPAINIGELPARS
jgi:hypothetical protein